MKVCKNDQQLHEITHLLRLPWRDFFFGHMKSMSLLFEFHGFRQDRARGQVFHLTFSMAKIFWP